MKMKFICEHMGQSSTGYFDKVTQRLEYETHNESLHEILEDFEYFLRGSGFHFEGQLTIQNDDDLIDSYDTIYRSLSESSKEYDDESDKDYGLFPRK